MIKIDGRKISKDILAGVEREISLLSFVPEFSDIFVGEDFVSKKYVEMKARIAERVGIKFVSREFESSISTEELVGEIKKLNVVSNMCGIIVQLPLPGSINKERVLDAIDPILDVDCLGKTTSTKFYDGEGAIAYPTALACLWILDTLDLDLKNKKIVVLGQGELVGKPVFAMLNKRGLRPIAVDKDTKDKEEILRQADVIIAGIGVERFIKKHMIKEGVVLIDAGTSESEGTLVGDVDYESVADMEGYISPVPGGVGPVTVAMLLQNILKVAKNKDGHQDI